MFSTNKKEKVFWGTFFSNKRKGRRTKEGNPQLDDHLYIDLVDAEWDHWTDRELDEIEGMSEGWKD